MVTCCQTALEICQPSIAFRLNTAFMLRLIAQGYSGEELLTRFKAAQKEVRPAVEKMLTEAQLVAESQTEYATYEDIFGTEEKE
mgnify:CR=1 FL=1